MLAPDECTLLAGRSEVPFQEVLRSQGGGRPVGSYVWSAAVDHSNVRLAPCEASDRSPDSNVPVRLRNPSPHRSDQMCPAQSDPNRLATIPK